MGKTKYRLNDRRWLNSAKDTHGRIIVAVENTESKQRAQFEKALKAKEEGGRVLYPVSPNVEFSIGDCSRVIHLDFSMYSPKSARKLLKKAKLLKKLINKFYTDFKAECDLYEEYVEKYKPLKERSKVAMEEKIIAGKTGRVKPLQSETD